MEKVNIQGVPETMLQTLFARAAHSQKKGLRFYDGKAIEMVQQLDYDFSKAEKDTAHCVSIFVTSQHYRCRCFRSVPKTKSKPSEVGSIWKGGQRHEPRSDF